MDVDVAIESVLSAARHECLDEEAEFVEKYIDDLRAKVCLAVKFYNENQSPRRILNELAEFLESVA